MTSAKSDAQEANTTQCPIPLQGIGRRIAAVVEAVGTRKFAAELMGVSTDALQRYIRDENKPTLEAVARLCLAANVSLEWVVTGNGEMGENPWQAAPHKESQGGRFDREILHMAVKLIRAIYDLVGAKYDVEADPDVLIETYVYLVEHDGEVSSADVIDLSKRLADRRRAKEMRDGHQQGTSGSAAGGAGSGQGKAGRIAGQGDW